MSFQSVPSGTDAVGKENKEDYLIFENGTQDNQFSRKLRRLKDTLWSWPDISLRFIQKSKTGQEQEISECMCKHDFAKESQEDNKEDKKKAEKKTEIITRFKRHKSTIQEYQT